MALKLMYITNNSKVALIAQKYGVDRIWIDLETLGKKERQGHIDSVKSKHTIEDIKKIASVLSDSEMLVRVNPIHSRTQEEIDNVVAAGADIIMLPMWKTLEEVQQFLSVVNKRTRTTLLLETKEAVECLDTVLKMGGFDEIHIGLNDLHLSYGNTFMFELVSNGTVEKLCNKIKKYNIPYGFGGIACIGEGLLPAEKIVMEHYCLGSSRVILSRSFCNTELIKDEREIETIFRDNLKKLRNFERTIDTMTEVDFQNNRESMRKDIENIVSRIKGKK